MGNVVQQPPIDLEGAQAPPHPKGGVTLNPSCTGMYNAIARSELLLGTGTATAPPQPAPSDDFSLPPAIVPPSTRAHAGRGGTPLRSTAARAGSTIPCRCRRGTAGWSGQFAWRPSAAAGFDLIPDHFGLFGGRAHAVPARAAAAVTGAEAIILDLRPAAAPASRCFRMCSWWTTKDNWDSHLTPTPSTTRPSRPQLGDTQQRRQQRTINNAPTKADLDGGGVDAKLRPVALLIDLGALPARRFHRRATIAPRASGTQTE